MTSEDKTDGPVDMARIDAMTMRCKRLGHEVPFKYCRTLEGKTVCRSIRDCWWLRFDVDGVLRQFLPEESIAALVRPQPKAPKLADIIRMAQEAKRLKEGSAETE